MIGVDIVNLKDDLNIKAYHNTKYHEKVLTTNDCGYFQSLSFEEFWTIWAVKEAMYKYLYNCELINNGFNPKHFSVDTLSRNITYLYQTKKICMKYAFYNCENYTQVIISNSPYLAVTFRILDDVYTSEKFWINNVLLDLLSLVDDSFNNLSTDVLSNHNRLNTITYRKGVYISISHDFPLFFIGLGFNNKKKANLLTKINDFCSQKFQNLQYLGLLQNPQG